MYETLQRCSSEMCNEDHNKICYQMKESWLVLPTFYTDRRSFEFHLQGTYDNWQYRLITFYRRTT